MIATTLVASLMRSTFREMGIGGMCLDLGRLRNVIRVREPRSGHSFKSVIRGRSGASFGAGPERLSHRQRSNDTIIN